MKYRFMLNVTMKENFAFSDPKNKLFLDYESALGYVETDDVNEISDEIRSGVICQKIFDLDDAFKDITDELFHQSYKNKLVFIKQNFDIKDDTLSLKPINSITGTYRDEVPAPKFND